MLGRGRRTAPDGQGGGGGNPWPRNRSRNSAVLRNGRSPERSTYSRTPLLRLLPCRWLPLGGRRGSRGGGGGVPVRGRPSPDYLWETRRGVTSCRDYFVGENFGGGKCRHPCTSQSVHCLTHTLHRQSPQNCGNREPEWSGWESVRMGGSDKKGDGLASQPRRYRVPGQPLLNRHQVGGVSRSPDGLFAQQEWEPIRGRPAVRGKRTDGGQPGQRVEEQGTWASRTQQGRLWTACGQRRVGSKNSQTTPATTSTSSIRQLLGAADAQTAHHATFNTAPTHQVLGSANTETTPARAPAAAADRKQQPDATCEGKNG